MEAKYKPIMIKTELKDLMDQMIVMTGKKMSYSQLIRHLISNELDRNNIKRD